MKKLTYSLCILTGALALGAGACSSSNSGTPTGTGGSGGSTDPNAIPLMPTTTGFVDDSATTGIIGAWYAYGDGVGSAASPASTDAANSDCQKKGGFTADKCSQIDSPKPGDVFPPDTTTGAMCTSGTAAMVLPGSSGSPDYSDLWGAGIGLDFNNPGGDAGVKGTWDGSAYAGIEFDFSGTMIPSKAMRVNFPFTGEHGTDSPYYQGATQAFSTLTNNSHVVIHWSDVGGPKYLSDSGTTPPAFDPTKIQSIQFQVFTNTASATPYAFCVNNLSVIKK
jgi:hypothetical protein